MSDKQHILNSIAAIARGLGRAPSRSEFVSLAGITDYHVLLCFPSWNDAVRAAGLHANTLNVRLEDSELLKDWGKTVRANRAIPARRAYRRVGKYDPRTLERRFGPWSSLSEIFLHFAKDNPEWADVVALLPVPVLKQEHGSNTAPASPILPNKTRHVPLKDRATYGNPTRFRGHIEFEFESRNFRDHGHPASGCDVIVCWRHNWTECPQGIEVVELSSVIQSLASSQS